MEGRDYQESSQNSNFIHIIKCKDFVTLMDIYRLQICLWRLYFYMFGFHETRIFKACIPCACINAIKRLIWLKHEN